MIDWDNLDDIRRTMNMLSVEKAEHERNTERERERAARNHADERQHHARKAKAEADQAEAQLQLSRELIVQARANHGLTKKSDPGIS